MNAMEILTGPFAQAVGWALLHLVWQATLVAGILAAVLSLLPRQSANARYTVSCAALATVFLLFVATAYRNFDPAAAPIPTAAPTAAESVSIPLVNVPVVLAATAAASWRDRAVDLASTARQSLPTVVALWFAGVLILSSRLLVSWFRARALLTKHATVAGAEWQRIATRLSHALGLRRAVTLLESAAVEVPSVLGTLRPVVLLPASALTGLTPEQLEMVLAHELAHIRRHDFFINLMQAFVETLMFYHPAVWWMSRRVRIERENCCDDLAVAVCGSPLQYAKALHRLEELRANAPALVVAANGGSLIERIRRIVSERGETTAMSSRWAAGLVMLALVIVAVAFPSVPALAQRDEQPTPAATNVEVVDRVPATDASEATHEDEEFDVDLHVDEPEEPEMPEIPDFPEAPEPPEAPYPGMAGINVHVPPLPPTALAVLDRLDLDLHEIDMNLEIDLDGHADDAKHDAKDERKEHIKEEVKERSRSRRFSDGGQLTVDELISLRAVGATPEYINEMRALFPDLTIGEASSLRALDVTREYVQQMRSAGFEVRTPREITGLKAVDVNPKWVAEIRAAGITIKTAREASGLKAVGVTPEFLRDLRAAGVAINTAREASSLAAVGVTPQFVQKLAKAGYTNLTARELARLAAVGIDDDFIRDMEQYRTKQ